MVVGNIFSFLFHGNNKRTTGERKAKSSVKICHEEAYACHIIHCSHITHKFCRVAKILDLLRYIELGWLHIKFLQQKKWSTIMVLVLATKGSFNESKHCTLFREGLLILCDETETVLHLECFLLLNIHLGPLPPTFLYKYGQNILFILTK
jgi:hypothetical protein